MEKVLKVGIISSTHGVRGEVKVFPTTDDAKRFKNLKEVLMDTGKELCPLQIDAVRFFQQFVILKFKDYDRLDDVEKFRGKALFVTREHAVKLNKDEYFIADLIGMNVTADDGILKGRLKDVLQTGANDVYVISLEDGREMLLPAIKECVLDISFEKNEIKIHILEGLLDG